MQIVLKAICVVGALMACSVARAADIYVSPDGVDGAGRGSISAPYRTLPYVLSPANNIAKANDRIILRGPAGNNVYRQNEVRLRVPLTIQSFDGEWAVIECPINVPDSVCVQIDPGASGSRLSRVEVKGGTIYSVFLQTNFDQQSNPTGRGASNITLEDCRLHGSGRDVVKITPKSDNVTIRRCEIFNSGQAYPPGTDLDDKNAEGIDNVNGSNMTVQDSYIHDIATTGIYWKGGAADALVERNRIERTGLGGILVGFDTSPEFFDLQVNPNYYEAIRGVVRNNLVRDTGYAGIGLYASQNATVVNNTIINTAKLGHAAIYFGVTLQDFDPVAKRPPNVGPTILNNTIVQSGGECASIRFSQDLGGLSGLSGATGMNNNYFHNTAGACRFTDRRTDNGPLENGGNLALWRTTLATDSASREGASPINAQGLLLSTGAGAALVGQGAAVAGLTNDLLRKPRPASPNRPDIGANQAVSSANGIECGLWQLTADCDGDGTPNLQEQIEGRNPDRKDNDIFASNRLFVRQVYQDFLGRSPDAAGLAFWEGALLNGSQTRQSMMSVFTTSGEFDALTAPMARLYFGTYLRIPDYPGLAFWTEEFRSRRRTLTEIGQAFATAPEFVNRYGAAVNSSAFVGLVYSNVLGRAADAAGLQYWTGELDTGRATRGSMLTQFTESDEYRGVRRGEISTTLLYAAMLRRSPSQAEFDAMVAAIRAGAPLAGEAQKLLQAVEYRARFLE